MIGSSMTSSDKNADASFIRECETIEFFEIQYLKFDGQYVFLFEYILFQMKWSKDWVESTRYQTRRKIFTQIFLSVSVLIFSSNQYELKA